MDLSCCETEPVRYPGAIQPHGVLLVLRRSSSTIEAVSESCQTWLGLSASHLPGQTLRQVFGPEFEAAVLNGPDEARLPFSRPLIPLLHNGRPFAVRSFGNDTGHLVVDMEPCETHDAARSLGLVHQCRQGLDALRQHTTAADVTQAATDLIRNLTGFDQVMIYRFDTDWHGQVVAESIAQNVMSYLGHHFPASDIPAQSRELFKLCRARLIPDVLYTPSALLATIPPQTIDLGRSSLRSVSPFHIEYLQNMGARATLVAALMVNGKLWGMVSCQHKNAPKFMTPADRDVIAWLCDDIAALLEARLVREQQALEHSLAQRRRTLIESIRQVDLLQIMQSDHNADLLGVVGADGFAWVTEGVVHTTGCTPDRERIHEMYRRYLERAGTLPLYASHALNHDLNLDDAGDGVAGALFVPVRRVPAATLIWFRRERHFSIPWGGNPLHKLIPNETGRVSPRKSFALFLQEVRGQSLAWQTEEIESAAELQVLVEINALRESEMHFKEAQHIACLGSWEWDLASNVNRWSDQQYRIFGHAPGAIRPSYDVFMGAVHPDDRPRVMQMADDAACGRAPCDMEFRIIRPDGHIRHIHSMGRLERDPLGAPMRVTGTLQDITQDVETRQRLESLLTEQKTLLDNILVGIAKARNRTIIWSNTVFATMLGYDPGELVGMETRRGFPNEEAWRAFGETVYPLPPPGQIRRTEIEFVCKDGRTIWVDLSGTMLDPATDTTLWCYVDITAKKQMASDLHTAQERLNVAQKDAHVGLWEWDAVTDRYDVTPAFEALVGIPSGVDSLTMNTIIHPDDYPHFLDRIDRAARLHEPYEAEFRVCLHSGRTIWILSRGSAIYDAAGNLTGFRGIVIDITDRKRMDAERDRLYKIIAELPEFVGMIDMQGRQFYLNQAGVRLLGQPDDVDCATLTIHDMHPPWAATRVVEEAIPTALAKGFWRGETALLHRDGHEIPAMQVVLAHRDPSGRTEYLSTIIHDISQQKAAEQTLMQAKECAEAANRAKSQFLANMSHEIRTPMNGVVGMIDILQHTHLDADQHRMLDTITQSSQALLCILNDILDYSKIEAGMLVIERIATSLTEVIHNVVVLMQSTARAQCIDLSVRIAPDVPTLIWSDPGRLRQVLLNLLGNAVKFTHSNAHRAGRVALHVETATRSDGTPVLLLQVIDNGIGMSDEVVAKLFQPFTQADASTARQFGGTGLGLAICQRLVTLMGGTIVVTSTPGQGSRFTVTLPLHEAPPDGTVVSVPRRRIVVRQQAPTVDMARATGQLVLLAEDNPTNSTVLREQLRLLGYASEMAADGPTALQMWRTHRYALLLTDCHMPGMDGFALTEAIRLAEPAGTRLPIIAVTANAMQGEADRCLACGMDDYLSKPVRLYALWQMLDKWLPLPPTQGGEPMDVSVSTTVDAPQSVIWDACALGEMVGNNPELHQRLLGQFLDNTRTQISTILAAAQTGQMPDAVRAAHTIKSAARTVGALALGDLCQQIEAAGLAGDAVTCQGLIAGLEQAFAQAQDSIRSHLAGLCT